MNDLHNNWKRKSYVFKYHRQRTRLAHNSATASFESKMATMQHNIFFVYQRRTWDELKRVLSVVHASQPVERAENLEYRNRLVCVEAPFNVQLSPSFWITLYMYIYIFIYLFIDINYWKQRECVTWKSLISVVSQTLRIMHIHLGYVQWSVRERA